jgi:hypothetical protein
MEQGYKFVLWELVRHGKIKVYILKDKGKIDFIYKIEQYKKDQLQEGKKLPGLIKTIEDFSCGHQFPEKKCRKFTLKKTVALALYEFKKDSTRIYGIYQEEALLLLHIAHKNTQPKDIHWLEDFLRDIHNKGYSLCVHNMDE